MITQKGVVHSASVQYTLYEYRLIRYCDAVLMYAEAWNQSRKTTEALVQLASQVQLINDINLFPQNPGY